MVPNLCPLQILWKTNELSKQAQDNVLGKYQSGFYKIITQISNILWNTIKSIIKEVELGDFLTTKSLVFHVSKMCGRNTLKIYFKQEGRY